MSHISIISTMTIDCTNIDENIIKYLKAKWRDYVSELENFDWL
jgi:hypothetical protein